MSMPEETNQLLREIRDVMVSQNAKYSEYLRESEKQIEKTREIYREYAQGAQRRQIVWMITVTVIVVIVLINR
ncbi:hypothetical protein [Lacipirellula sp.]|uniref:hypothetical protein n=1 Tax=Lacipirellula sp. TaxID=2691419 RepID=UPI003D10B643